MEYSISNLTGEEAPNGKAKAGADQESRLVQRPSEVFSASPKPASTQYRYWVWEFIALFDAVLALAIIVVILRCYDGNPLPQWPLNISINTALSILSTIYKISLLFVVTSCIGQLQWCWFSGQTRQLLDWVRYDEATRGPWGAALLVWSQRGRQPLVILATFILICAIIVEPFVQELAKLEDCSVLATENYMAPLSANTHLAGPEPWANTTRLYGWGTIPDVMLAIQTRVSQGLYGTRDLSGTRQCITGNCTFAPYQSLGYCRSCEDISSSIELTRIDDDDFISKIPGGPTMRFSNAEWEKDGQAVLATLTSEGPASDLSLAHSVQYLAGETKFSKRGYVISQGVSSYCEPGESNLSWDCAGYGAAKCTLGPCVRESVMNVTLGEWTEHVLAVSDIFQDWSLPSSSFPRNANGTDDGRLWALVDTQCLADTEKSQLLNNCTFVEDSPSCTERDPSSFSSSPAFKTRYTAAFNDIIQRDSKTKNSLLRRRCLFIMDRSMASQFIPSGYQARLVGNLTIRNPDHPSYISSSPFGSSPLHLAQLYYGGVNNFHDIDRVFGFLATSLTDFISTNGGVDSIIEGVTYQYAICLRVIWDWVVFPVVVVFAAAALFALVVIITARRGLPAWKFSPVVWLLRGPGRGKEWHSPNSTTTRTSTGDGDGGDDDASYRDVASGTGLAGNEEEAGGEEGQRRRREESMEGMRARARGVRVALRDDGGGAWIERVD